MNTKTLFGNDFHNINETQSMVIFPFEGYTFGTSLYPTSGQAEACSRLWN